MNLLAILALLFFTGLVCFLIGLLVRHPFEKPEEDPADWWKRRFGMAGPRERSPHTASRNRRTWYDDALLAGRWGCPYRPRRPMTHAGTGRSPVRSWAAITPGGSNG